MAVDPLPQPQLPTDWRKWVLGARPRTLPAAVAPVLVGTAAAGRDLRLWALGCALGVAVFVQIATNYANDYSDGARGTDDPGERVGPPRLVGSGLARPGEVKRAMLAAFALTALCGLPLVVLVSPWLLLVGIAAIAAGWFYTGGPSPYGYAGLGEVFVFVFFGLVATTGSCFVQTESWSWLAFGCGVAMGCLSTALLVINNLRDIPGDTRSGKRTLAVRLGDRSTRYLYVVLLVAAMLCVPFIAGLSGRLLASLSLLAVVPARRPVVAVLGGEQGPALIGVLADTAKVQMVFGALLAAGLFLAA